MGLPAGKTKIATPCPDFHSPRVWGGPEKAGRSACGSSVFLTVTAHFSRPPVLSSPSRLCSHDFLPQPKVSICSGSSNLFQLFLFWTLREVDVINGPIMTSLSTCLCHGTLQSLPTPTLGQVTCCGQWDLSKSDESRGLPKTCLLPSLSSAPAYVSKPGG